MDGCVSDTIEKLINIGAKPIADFLLSDTCTDKTLGIQDRSGSAFGAYVTMVMGIGRKNSFG